MYLTKACHFLGPKSGPLFVSKWTFSDSLNWITFQVITFIGFDLFLQGAWTNAMLETKALHYVCTWCEFFPFDSCTLRQKSKPSFQKSLIWKWISTLMLNQYLMPMKFKVNNLIEVRRNSHFVPECASFSKAVVSSPPISLLQCRLPCHSSCM